MTASTSTDRSPTVTTSPTGGTDAPRTRWERGASVSRMSTLSSSTATTSATVLPPLRATKTSMRRTPERRRPSTTSAARAVPPISRTTAAPLRCSTAPLPRSATGAPPIASAIEGWTRRTATATPAAARHRARVLRTTTSSVEASRITCTWRSSPSGDRAATSATPSIHDTIHDVGLCSQWAATESPPNSPANSPAGIPHTITGPETGTARRFAGSEATGSPPVIGRSNGATAIWAAVVTAAASEITRGPGIRRPSGLASTTIPTLAATDSWKPSDLDSDGSTSNSTTIADASTIRLSASRPSVTAAAPIPAMVAARRTDGSMRVMTAKKPRTANVARRRPISPNRRSSGPARTSTNATLEPETASRWVRPEPENASSVSTSCPRRSPSTRPR